MSRPCALLLTWSGDHYTPDQVAEGLLRRGVRPIRVDTDLFPTELDLRWRIGRDGLHPAGSGPLAGVDPAQVVGVWWRRFWSPRLPEDMEPEHVAACVREIHAASTGFFRAYSGARHVNDPARERAAEDKLRQLVAARAAGLRCPETLITNEPAAVRAFWEQLGGRMITKMLTPYSRSMLGDGDFVHTSRVSPEDLEDLDGLRLCPMVFQEEIPRAREHRVLWVGGRVFGGSLRTAEMASADWRTDLSLRWEPSTVPAEVVAGMGRLMRELGLLAGAFDLMETPAGDWVFLEVNPAGEWGMLERDLGLPIGDAIAAALTGEST